MAAIGKAIKKLFARLGACKHRWAASRSRSGKQKCLKCENYRSLPPFEF